MFKIRRCINILNMHPEKAEEHFKYKRNKPITRYRIIKKLCKQKVLESRKCFKNFRFWNVDDYSKAMNYLILTLTAYKATAEVIYDRRVNVITVCQIFKPNRKNSKHSTGVIKRFSICLEVQQTYF